MHVTDPGQVEAITAATHMMVEARRLYPEFDWRGDAGRWADLLTGSTRFRDMLEAGAAAEIVGAWRERALRAGRPARGRTSSTVARGDEGAAPGGCCGRGAPPCSAVRSLLPVVSASAAALAPSHVAPPAGGFDRPAATVSRRPAPCCVTAPRPAPGSTRHRSGTRLDQIAALGGAVGHDPAAVRRCGHADGPRRDMWSPARPAATRCATPTVPGRATGDQWVPMRDDTIFDMASVGKLFTSILVMQQVERGAIRLDEPVATYLPEFAANGKASITVRQLLTHTSGLGPGLPLWSHSPDKASRIQAVMDQPLERRARTTSTATST